MAAIIVREEITVDIIEKIGDEDTMRYPGSIAAKKRIVIGRPERNNSTRKEKIGS
jgi:hypothetical protein